MEKGKREKGKGKREKGKEKAPPLQDPQGWPPAQAHRLPEIIDKRLALSYTSKFHTQLGLRAYQRRRARSTIDMIRLPAGYFAHYRYRLLRPKVQGKPLGCVGGLDTVAKIFYCGGLCGRLGMLRAVVPVDDLHHALSKDSLKYVGKRFPKMKETGTVIEVAPDERGLWKAGFYRAAKGPLEFEDHLRAL